MINVEIEKAVLSSLIFRNESIAKTIRQVSENSFQENKNKILYSTIKSMYISGTPIDLVTLWSRVEELKLPLTRNDLLDITDNGFQTGNIDYYIKVLKKEETKRKLVEIAKDIQQKGEEQSDKEEKEILAEIQSKIISLSSEQEEEKIENQIQKLKQVQKDFQEKPKGSLIGISTGFEKLDNVIDGFRPGHFWVLGGYTSAGKTYASLNLVANLIKQKRRVVFYSLEMTEVDILSRLCGILTKQNTKVILRGENTKEIQTALDLIEESDFEIITNIREITDIQFSMIERNTKSKVDLFVLDFLQLVHVKGAKGDYEKLTTVAHKLQDTAKMVSSTVLALSQISNESAKLQSEDISGFKGSGDIEAAADMAIKLKHAEDSTKEYKSKLYHVNKEKGKVKESELPKVMWGIHKNRHGESGTIDMRFNGYTGEFLPDPFDTF
jgi:replicative DNA helicase